MQKVALSVSIECHPGFRDQVVAALLEHRTRCLKDEPGTLQFEVLLPENDDSYIVLFELYADQSALTAHSNGHSITQYRKEVESKIKNVVAKKCAQILSI